MAEDESSGKDCPEAIRLRALRRAEGFGDNASRWAHHLGWTETALSNYETGFRRVPRDAALRLYQKVAGFDPLWLWTGEKRGLSHDLKRRIEAAELIERDKVAKASS